MLLSDKPIQISEDFAIYIVKNVIIIRENFRNRCLIIFHCRLLVHDFTGQTSFYKQNKKKLGTYNYIPSNSFNIDSHYLLNNS